MNNNIITNINNNRLFSGCTMLIMNMCGKYFAKELPNGLDQIAEFSIFKYIILFSFTFVATRCIIHSILLTLLFLCFSKYFFNTNSVSCILPKKNKEKKIEIADVISAQNLIKQYKIDNNIN